ncbi:MAG: DUF6503 family protein [Nonlabens sp.]|nr:DUF6503 family protein [Nonlabens sp.]
MRRAILIAVCLCCTIANAQEINGMQLLERSIAYHDPSGNWQNFVGYFTVTMSTPDKSDRVSNIHINLPENRFKVSAVRDSIETMYMVEDNISTVFETNLNTNLTEQVTNEAAVKRAVFMKDYYTYLYGLPMKLQDPGTIISETVSKKNFKGKEYLVLEVRYEPGVGTDVWYFYFDPKTYAMEVYQFYRVTSDGSIDKNSGEYILLTENAKVQGINMPKSRAWYYNKNDVYLGTDRIID